ncbi:MAG: GNAT family N-acetyltransferase [Acaryochloridaceae cyanobacterium SU_2_1]|nr:GNAT family N-acetyltransferase [Acaryochloridaceae cyanobacterium SU_2_1]
MSESVGQHQNPAYTVGPILNPQQALQLGHILSQCFNVSLNHWQTYTQQLGQQNLRLVCQGNQVLGGLGVYPMGQWFGGQRITMSGIAGLGIAPEHRGRGAALTLVLETLKTLHQQRIPMATLYASTSHLYRQAGFEQAGTYCQYRLPTQSLISSPSDRTLPLTTGDTNHLELCAKLYQQQAQQNNGNLDRHPALWEQMFDLETPVYVTLIGTEQQPEGYVIFTHQAVSGGYDLRILDLVLLTPLAIRRYWTFLADHRSLARDILWYGAPVDPAQLLLLEQTYQVQRTERWLMRMIDFPQALTLRGYPQGLEAELHLEVEDPQLPANSGRLILQVAQGQGRVSSGGKGHLKLTIRGAAPLYTSLLTAEQLQTLGFLSGPAEVLAQATTIFSGPQPWMGDHF